MARTCIVALAVALLGLVRPEVADGQGVLASGVVATTSIESSNQVAVAGAIAYRVNRLFGFGIEVMSVPTLKPDVARVDVANIPVAALVVEGTDGRATVFTTNVRVEMPTNAHLIPYVVVGGGVANVKEIFAVSVPVRPGVPAVIPSRPETRSLTDLALMAGGGLSVIAAAHVSIDLDARYMRLVADRDLNVGRFGIGVGYRF